MRELADATQVPVVADSPWALHPATADAAQAVRAAAPRAALVEVFTAADTPPAIALLDQLSLLRTAVGTVPALHVTRLDAHGHSASARFGDIPVRLSGVRSATGTTDARLVRP